MRIRKIILELNEHDLLRLLVLAKKETQHAHNPWRPYWEHLSQKLLKNLDRPLSAEFQPDPDTDNELPE